MPTKQITRTRGDTYRIGLTFKESDGSLIDLSGGTITLTVNEENAPDDTANELFQSVGVDGDLTNGYAHFPLTADNADHLGRFYYDIEFIDSSGKKRTLLEGEYIVEQDITKSDETFEWTRTDSYSDGTQFTPTDASVDWLVCSMTFPEWGSTGSLTEITNETRDTRKVIRSMVKAQTAYTHVMWHLWGPPAPRKYIFQGGWEWRVTGYINKAMLTMYISPGDLLSYVQMGVDTRDGTVDLVANAYMLDAANGGITANDYAPPSTSGWTVAGWYEVALRVDEDRMVWCTIHPEGEDDDFGLVFSATDIEPVTILRGMCIPALRTARVIPEDAASVFDLWKYEWRRL
jgi:hypothetical protein